MKLPLVRGNKGNWFRTMMGTPEQRSMCETKKHIVISMFIDEFLLPRGRLAPKVAKVLSANPAGLWLCQNQAADHYGALVMHKVRTSRMVRGRATQVFTCDCGFSFSAFDNARDSRGQPVRTRIKELGPIFLKKCRDLHTAGCSRSSIALKFGVNLKLVGRILDETFSEAVKVKERVNAPKSAAALAEIEQYWNLRGRVNKADKSKKVDHESRDLRYAQEVIASATLIGQQQPAIRVSRNRIRKRAGISNYVLREARDKYPRTVEALRMSQESQTDFQLRMSKSDC